MNSTLYTCIKVKRFIFKKGSLLDGFDRWINKKKNMWPEIDTAELLPERRFVYLYIYCLLYTFKCFKYYCLRDSSKLFQLWNINFLGKCTLDFIVILGITYAEWSQPTLSFSFVNTLFGPVSVDKRSKNRIILMLLLETVRYSEISALTSLFIMFYLVCLVIIFPLCRFIVR